MKMLVFSFLILLVSVTSSGIFELYKEKQRQKEFEESLKNLYDKINIKKVVKCIEENFKEDADKEFISKLKNKSIGIYKAQRTFLFTQYKRYSKCIKEGILYFPNEKFKREYYY